MTKIRNTNIYKFDVSISDNDYVIGSDAETLGKVTKNYKIGNLREYINAGLAPEVGGTLKITEVKYEGVLTTPSDVANNLSDTLEVLQYNVVVFNVNGDVYLLNLQNVSLGATEEPIFDYNFTLLSGSKNVGNGAKVIKGIDTDGKKQHRTLKPVDTIVKIVENADTIDFNLDIVTLKDFIGRNQQTNNIANVGNGAKIYKNSTISSDVKTFNLRTLESSTLELEETDTTIKINTPASATIPALYVNDLYIPTQAEFLAGNTKGEGTLAKPFTNTVTAYVGGVPTITPNTAIQNALIAYVGTGTRLNPEKAGQQIKVQDNNVGYIFTGDLGYSRINIDFSANVNATIAGYLIDMDNATHFNTLSDRATITVNDGYYLNISGEGFNNSGTNIATFVEQQSRAIALYGRISSVNNDITKYIINSDITSTGNNNDGALTFLLDGDIYAEQQGLIRIGGVSRVWNYGKIQSSTPNATINPALKAYLFLGGDFRSFQGSRLEFAGTRTDGFVFTPTGGYTPQMVGQSATLSSLATITNLFNKTNNNNASLLFSNSDSSTSLLITNIFESTNLWRVVFNRNMFERGIIDPTKVDLTMGNLISVSNNIEANLIESLRIFEDRADAILAGLPLYSAYLKTGGVAYPSTSGWIRDVVLPA